MNPAAPPLRDLAERLLAMECDNGEDTTKPAARRVCDKFGGTLSKLAGTAGYRSLLTRALALAQAYAPALKTVHVASDGTLEGFSEAKETTTKEEFTRGEIALVVQLLSLLHTFIGEPLTQQLVKEAWPVIDPSSSTDS